MSRFEMPCGENAWWPIKRPDRESDDHHVKGLARPRNQPGPPLNFGFLSAETRYIYRKLLHLNARAVQRSSGMAASENGLIRTEDELE